MKTERKGVKTKDMKNDQWKWFTEILKKPIQLYK